MPMTNSAARRNIKLPNMPLINVPPKEQQLLASSPIKSLVDLRDKFGASKLIDED